MLIGAHLHTCRFDKQKSCMLSLRSLLLTCASLQVLLGQPAPNPNPNPNPAPNPAPAPAPSGTAAAPAPSGSANATVPACNPFLETCPGADCVDSGTKWRL